MAYGYDAIFYGGSGAAPTATVCDSSAAPVAVQPAGTVAEVGSGFWYYATDAMPAGHRGFVKFTRGAVVLSVTPVSPRETENADVRTSNVTGRNVRIVED